MENSNQPKFLKISLHLDPHEELEYSKYMTKLHLYYGFTWEEWKRFRKLDSKRFNLGYTDEDIENTKEVWRHVNEELMKYCYELHGSRYANRIRELLNEES